MEVIVQKGNLYPFKIDDGIDGHLLATEGEVADLIVKLEEALFDFNSPEEHIVQVAVEGSMFSQTAYNDPTGELNQGDRVIVPYTMRDTEKFGTVVGFGRDSYTGPVKDVIARLELLS